jgi:hypothetical protein
VLLQSLTRVFVYRSERNLYPYVYWLTEFVAVVIGCGIVLEVYRVGLSAYPGAARMARKLLLFVFSVSTAKALLSAASHPGWWAQVTVNEIEQVLRVVQALAILAIVVLFLFYGIPFGRNLGGILLGYGLFIAGTLAWLTLFDSGSDEFRNFWFYLNPALYGIALGVWALHLWSHSPEPGRPERLEHDYQRVAAATRLRLDAARGHLAKVARP